MKPTRAAVKAAAEAFAKANVPPEFYAELGPQVVDVCLTALNTEKGCSRAFTPKRVGESEIRIEISAILNRTPHTTLEDKIKVEFYVINKARNVFLP